MCCSTGYKPDETHTINCFDFKKAQHHNIALSLTWTTHFQKTRTWQQTLSDIRGHVVPKQTGMEVQQEVNVKREPTTMAEMSNMRLSWRNLWMIYGL